MLGIDIHINSKSHNVSEPVNIISKFSLWDNANVIPDKPYLLFGYDSDAEHFQSLIPRIIVVEEEVGMINNIPFSYADAVKTSKLIDVDLHIKFPLWIK